MTKKTVVVFCTSKEEITEAVQNWVVVNGYARAYTFNSEKESGHYFQNDEKMWTESEHTFGKKYKTVLVFQK